ncbi:hypothetical protein BT67DRAFT_206882 [Trichocladium antarcticum]|uniref:Zn(2)-C6 fungal-type domain-containing protein n=1 Tax=Trichocladium antarcticum TaxID=1450529 RepID=A0AAN6UD76_9PEZI|nr:hypothetical protein BT67DRAFT_206882 [Trichocladium antarcticum]
MSVSTEETLFTAARSRRLACDRCHRHKLRCERSPVIVNGNIAVPLGSCKRCMKARVPCQTVAGTFTTSSSASPRRKSYRVVDQEGPGGEPTEDTEPPITASDVSISFSATTEAASYDSGPYGASSPPFNHSDASMLDIDAFNLGTGDFMGIGSTTTSSDTLNSLALVGSPLTTCGLLLDDEPGGDGTLVQMDHPEVQMQYDGFVDLTCFGGMARPSGSDASPGRPMDYDEPAALKTTATLPPAESGSREDCRRRLLELHSLLFNELQCITHADLADALFSADSPGLSSSDKAGLGDNLNIIRRVLFASERLLELLRIIRAADAGSRLGLGTGSMGSYSVSQCKGGPASPTASGRLLRHSLLPAGSTGSTGSTGSDGETFLEAAPSFVDLPFVISFLTCHVGLLSVYRAVFTHIHEALRAREPIRPTSGRHRSWPGPSSRAMRGSLQQATALTSQHVLGIRIQMEVMTHMLEQVGDAWAGAAMDGGVERQDERLDREAGATLFGSPATMALLQVMLRYEGYSGASDEGCRVGLATLMNLQKSIRKLLRSSNVSENF